MVKRVLITYYGVVFAFEVALSFFFSTYAIFLISHGLDLFEVSMVNFVFMLGCFVFEVPTGAMADSMGRKPSFIISCFTLSLSFLVYYLSKSMPGFVLAEIIGALAVTFQSGAFDAWLIDSVKYYDKSYDMNPIYRGKTQVLQIGRIIGVISGAYVGQIDLALPWLASSIGTFLVGILSIFVLREDYRTSEDNVRALPAILQIGRDSISFGLKNKSVLFIIVVSAVYTLACMPLNMYWQVRFSDDYNLVVRDLGFVHAAALVAIMIGAWLAKYNKKLFRREKHAIILSLGLFVCGLVVAASVLPLKLVLLGYLITEIARGNYDPQQAAYINDRIPSKVRATILSFDEMISKLGAMAGLVVCGLIADHFGIRAAWMSAAFILLVCLPFFVFAKNGE